MIEDPKDASLSLRYFKEVESAWNRALKEYRAEQDRQAACDAEAAAPNRSDEDSVGEDESPPPEAPPEVSDPEEDAVSAKAVCVPSRNEPGALVGASVVSGPQATSV